MRISSSVGSGAGAAAAVFGLRGLEDFFLEDVDPAVVDLARPRGFSSAAPLLCSFFDFFGTILIGYRTGPRWQVVSPALTLRMRHFVFRWAVTTVAVMVASSIIHGIRYDNVTDLMLAALLLGFLNAFVRPILLILSAPLILLTLGFFILIVNALMLTIVPHVVTGFHVEGFGSAFWGAIVISIVSWLLSAFFRGSDGRVRVLTHHTQIKRVQGRVISPGE